MKYKFLSVALSFMILLATVPAKAGIIYDFDVSDVSWAGTISGSDPFNGVSLFFEFESTTNFDSVQLSDLLRGGVIIGGTTYESAFFNGINVANLFASISASDDIYLKVGEGEGIDANLFAPSSAGFSFQVGQNSMTSLITNAGGVLRFAHDDTSTHNYRGVQRSSVPEPSTLAIFALGMIGLASRRLKKQS